MPHIDSFNLIICGSIAASLRYAMGIKMKDDIIVDTTVNPTIDKESVPVTLSEEQQLLFNNMKQQILELIQKNMSSEAEVDSTDTLEDIGINSVLFIKLVVAVEQKFDIEFDDAALNFSQYPDVQSLLTYAFNKYNDMLN